MMPAARELNEMALPALAVIGEATGLTIGSGAFGAATGSGADLDGGGGGGCAVGDAPH